MTKTPFYREDDDELLGYIIKDKTSWQAQTFFGYPIARTTTKQEAERVLRDGGLSYLLGTWQYFDKDEQQWFPCIIKEAFENRVIVIRTNSLGHQEPGSYKYVTLQNPDENTLVKAD